MIFIRNWVLLTALYLFFHSGVFALPVVDGRFDPDEGYSMGYKVTLNVQKTGIIPQQGELWLYQDPISKDLFIAFTQPLELIDNTYGRNAMGYPKNHNLSDLEESDTAEFVIRDISGNILLDVVMDYIHYSKGQYSSPGVIGGEGYVKYGSGSMVTQWGTSLDYNFNTLGFVLTKDSPATDADYTPNPSYAGWLYEVTYEMRIDGSLFANNPFGSVAVPLIHDSPNKTGLGRNKVYGVDYTLFYTEPEQPPVIGDTEIVPEPSSVILIMLSLSGIWFVKRKKA